jgi:hypothetical protein
MLEANYTVFDYTGKKQFSTFDPSQESPTPGPVAQPIAPTGAANAGALASLVGVPIGSRILMHLPPQQGQAAFVVLDLIDSMPISPA